MDKEKNHLNGEFSFKTLPEGSLHKKSYLQSWKYFL